jgi:hypothetical protein
VEISQFCIYLQGDFPNFFCRTSASILVLVLRFMYMRSTQSKCPNTFRITDAYIGRPFIFYWERPQFFSRQSVCVGGWVCDRVTRLGDFSSTYWVIISFGQFLFRYRSSPNLWITFFHGKSFYLITYGKKWLHFGRFFNKLIWSPWWVIKCHGKRKKTRPVSKKPFHSWQTIHSNAYQCLIICTPSLFY